MRATIQSVKSFTTNPTELGITHFDMRVRLLIGDKEETISVTAEELLDFHAFQEVLLTRTGRFITFGLADTKTEHEAFTLWQKLLDQATWYDDNEREFEVRGAGDEEEPSEEEELLIRLEE